MEEGVTGGIYHRATSQMIQQFEKLLGELEAQT